MIIVPFDFSKKAITSLDQALYLSSSSGLAVELVHITNRAAVREYPRTWNYSSFDDRYLENKMNQIVEARIKKLNLNHSVTHTCYVTESVMISGAIIKRAINRKARLLVMGTHGFSGAADVLLGSNTSSIINQALIPVLAIPMNWKPKPLMHVIIAAESNQISKYRKIASDWSGLFQCDQEWIEFYYLPDKDQLKKIKEKYPELKLVKADILNSLAENLVKYTSKRKNSALMMFVHQRNLLQKIFNSSITENVSGLIKIPLLALPVKK
ncbi:MAG: universal stress protein [Bacteroidota bacterium]|jgi:nucleotide-binding universal stress UspA family protein